MSDVLLALRDVSYRYDTQESLALKAFSLDIVRGSVTAILGPNGAGKTTLLHLIMGWLRRQGGSIDLDGRPLGSYTRRALGQMIALVPQSEHVVFEYSLMEYVLLGRAPYLKPLDMPGEEDCRIALAALEQVGLGNLRMRAITSLSGGERQMVLMARALAQQPKILLLDEPTSHLDLGNKGRLLRLLEQLVQQGVTVVLTTHEPEVAASIATHLVLVRDGQVKHVGRFDEVFTAEQLSETYGVPVKVCAVDGQHVVLWHDIRQPA
ncbi:MAG: ABC transporter ATP-binding protein [Anaerolineae bacterium]|nr:ABC transporter ATP-binding protein [Anaerolineae bacterium]